MLKGSTGLPLEAPFGGKIAWIQYREGFPGLQIHDLDDLYDLYDLDSDLFDVCTPHL